MNFYRKKPEVVRAVAWTGENTADIVAMSESIHTTPSNFRLNFWDGENIVVISVGDFIIQDPNGSIEIEKKESFNKKYEQV